MQSVYFVEFEAFVLLFVSATNYWTLFIMKHKRMGTSVAYIKTNYKFSLCEKQTARFRKKWYLFGFILFSLSWIFSVHPKDQKNT